MRDDADIAVPAREPDDAGGHGELVRLEGVGVKAGSTQILNGLSLTIRGGAPTAVIGPNGSGKTTMLRVMMGLVVPDVGTVVAAPSLADGAGMAIVFQKPVMLRRSAADNIALALQAVGRRPDTGAVQGLLGRVGIAALADRPARRLSGGEQQRLALARALACEPRLLLLDEPTASLDPAQTKIVEEIIAQIARSGVKIVMATHNLGQAKRLAGDVVLLVKGRAVEQAPTAELFSAPLTEEARRFLARELVL